MIPHCLNNKVQTLWHGSGPGKGKKYTQKVHIGKNVSKGIFTKLQAGLEEAIGESEARELPTAGIPYPHTPKRRRGKGLGQ